MKNIKCFKYINENNFNIFLNEYGYKLGDVKGFSVADKKQCRNNVLKTYAVHFNDGEYEYFKIAIFRNPIHNNTIKLQIQLNFLIYFFINFTLLVIHIKFDFYPFYLSEHFP